MNYKLILLCTISQFASAVLVKMPDAKKLQQKFDSLGLSYLNEKTKIINTLANQDLEAVVIAAEIEKSIWDFNEYTKNTKFAAHMETCKPLLLEKLLEHNVRALDELKGHGLLKK